MIDSMKTMSAANGAEDNTVVDLGTDTRLDLPHGINGKDGGQVGKKRPRGAQDGITSTAWLLGT